jgi:hypothetical protein
LLAQSVRQIDTTDTVVTIDKYEPGMQIGSVRVGRVTAALYVSDIGATPGAGLANLRAGSTPVELAGRGGFVTTVRTSPASWLLAWEYAPDGWAFMVGCMNTGPVCPRTPADLSRLASAVRFDAPTPIGVPVAVGYLRSGLTLASAGRIFGTDTFDDEPSQAYGMRLQFVASDPARAESAGFDISVEPSAAAGWAGPTDPGANAPADGAIGGRPVRWSGKASVPAAQRQRAFVDYGTCTVSVQGSLGNGVSASANHDEIMKIIEGLRLADCSDHSTWFDATAAIPGGDAVTVMRRLPSWSVGLLYPNPTSS